jgi:hypothetical protein
MFKNSLRITVLAAVMVVASGSGVAASADVTPVDPYLLQVANGDAPTNPTSQAVPGRIVQRAAGSTSYAVTCTGQIQDPHYSSGAGGAIAKVDITCKGSGVATVSVRTRGLLTFAPSSSATNTHVTFSNRATSDQTQTVSVNGGAKTYYLPQVGGNGGRGTGFWRATFTWQITSLPNATVGSDTKTVWKAV